MKTVQQAINFGLPSLSAVARQSEAVCKSAVIVELSRALDFLNVGKTMDETQVMITVEMIIECYPHFSLADLRLFFSRLMRGHYGKLYDRIDGQIILEAMEKYNSERMDSIENSKNRQHNEFKRAERAEGLAPEVADVLKQIVGEKKPFAAKYERPEPNEGEKFHQRCLKQFDNLYFGNFETNRNYAYGSGIRALKFGKLVLTVQDFLERKIYYRNYRNLSEEDREKFEKQFE